MELARWILIMTGTYVGAGVLFGIPFVVSGIGRVDPAARKAGWGFRAIVLPGVVALWPVMLGRWVTARRRRS